MDSKKSLDIQVSGYPSIRKLIPNDVPKSIQSPSLTDGIFETGAYGVPSKSQNPTLLNQGGPSSKISMLGMPLAPSLWHCLGSKWLGFVIYLGFRMQQF